MTPIKRYIPAGRDSLKKVAALNSHFYLDFQYRSVLFRLVSGAMFGHAITCLGDTDFDGKQVRKYLEVFTAKTDLFKNSTLSEIYFISFFNNVEKCLTIAAKDIVFTSIHNLIKCSQNFNVSNRSV